MTFFDQQGIQIPCQQWLNTYEPSYFRGKPTFGKRFHGGYQVSQYVEARVCALLGQTTVLSLQDLTLVMAWKLGEIDHRCSEAAQKIVYRRSWDTTLRDRYRRDFSVSINYLAANMTTTQAQANQGNLQCLFDRFPRLKHSQLKFFDSVYLLTVLFFITYGKEPIYDRFAHKAALAIDQGVSPGQAVSNYKQVQTWAEYQLFKTLLTPISQACSQQSPMFISRPVDRALWVYGHFF
jgi:hypothetical protein